MKMGYTRREDDGLVSQLTNSMNDVVVKERTVSYSDFFVSIGVLVRRVYSSMAARC
jgi:hypothetical protein